MGAEIKTIIIIDINKKRSGNTALFTSSFSYFKNSKIGTLLVLIGTLVIIIGGGWINVIGYTLLTIGFYINFKDKNKS